MSAVVRLLDANVLAAMTLPEHVHHDRAMSFFETAFRSAEASFATCPTVQGALLRLLLREGSSVQDAVAVLSGLVGHRKHRQWLDDVSYVDVDLTGVRGHRQVTDAYLAQLARVRGGRLATLDRGLAQSAPDVVELLPS